eukprot:969716-Pelagomonas_calceolata.AAC.11
MAIKPLEVPWHHMAQGADLGGPLCMTMGQLSCTGFQTACRLCMTMWQTVHDNGAAKLHRLPDSLAGHAILYCDASPALACGIAH